MLNYHKEVVPKYLSPKSPSPGQIYLFYALNSGSKTPITSLTFENYLKILVIPSLQPKLIINQ